MQIRLTQKEYEAIDRKFRNSGLRSRSEFIRAMIFEGYIVQMDGNELRGIYKLANSIANSINQIAVRVNSTSRVYDDDIRQIKDDLYRLWKPLLFLQNKLLQLKR